MHSALSVPAILDEIFSFTDQGSDASAALVCKTWQEIALDALWYHTDRLDRLFNILAPMTYITPTMRTFTQYTIPPSHWPRFLYYSNRVHHLSLTEMAPHIDHEAYSTIALSRPVLNIFPNLIGLNVVVPFPPSRNLPHLSLFLYEGLRRLTVSIPETVQIGDGLGYSGSSGEEVDPASADIGSWSFFFADVLRSPHIEHLTLTPMWSPRAINHILSSFLESLKDLRTITIYDALLTSEVVSVLSRCPRLEVVQGSSIILPISKPDGIESPGPHDDSDDDSDDSDESIEPELGPFSPALGPSAFPVLRSLSLRATVTDVTTFINSAFFPSGSLTSLCIHTLHQEVYHNIKSFFATLAELCTGLTTIVLRMPEVEVEGPNLYGWFEFGMELEFVDFDVIEPLCAFSNLRLFILNTLYPLSLNDEEIKRMAMAWPELEELDLNHYPSPAFNPLQRLTLAGVAAFAEHCPKLRTLRLHILPELDFDSYLEPPTPFQKLEIFVLSILYRGDYNTYDFAAFLSDVIPSKCSVTHHFYQESTPVRPNNNSFGMPMGRDWVTTSKEAWRQVERSVPFFRETEDRWFGPVWEQRRVMNDNTLHNF